MKVIKLSDYKSTLAKDFITDVEQKNYEAILADPPWRFQNRTGKMTPEHKRLNRYPTLSLDEIKEIPAHLVANNNSHLYLWVPNALLKEGLDVLEAWGFKYKSKI